MAGARVSARLPVKAGKASLALRQSHTAAAPSAKPLTSILIANRGEIALRVGRTAADNGIKTTTIYTDPDAKSQHALSSPFNVNLGASNAYLDGNRIIDVARQQGCDSIHPGYGFLSENSEFARRCVEAGIVFIGPPSEAIEAMGNKSRSKEIMTAAGVPCIPGYHGTNQDAAFLQGEADKIGFPVLLKAVKGGGGKGMRISFSADDFQDQLVSAKSEAKNSFGDDTMLVEKYIQVPRHIEVQVFADKHGNCVALGERDCSIQRRHQKILEESPAPNLEESIRQDLYEKARAAALAVKYEGAGTVEFIFDNETGEFFFMEMNTRLQVEHPVTEMVTGLDLVQWQIAVAQGERLPMTQEQVEERISQRGHAIEARIYAENPDMNFIPDSGKLLHLKTPAPTADVRIDAGFIEGDEVSAFYDPMIAKLIVRGDDRPSALRKLKAALESYEIAGPVTNIEFLKRVCESTDFADGKVETGYIEKHRDELFTEDPTPTEVWAQAALGLLLQETASTDRSNVLLPAGLNFGFGTTNQHRTIHLARQPTDPNKQQQLEQQIVHIQQLSPDTYSIRVGEIDFSPVTASLSGPNGTQLTAYYPHTRLESTLIPTTTTTNTSTSSTPANTTTLSLFHASTHHRLLTTPPPWLPRALGTSLTSAASNSVTAPMPCKILRVDVKAGDRVKKEQALVVIESMKMETVIRSPVEGVVGRVGVGEGDICKAGTALVEFEMPEVETETETDAKTDAKASQK